MGKKPKSSRKGKKAWRANISTEDISDFYEKSTKDALTGGSVSHVADDSLFFLDKSTDVPLKTKIEKHREKVLHCDSLLRKNPFVEAVPSSTDKKSTKKRKVVAKPEDVQKSDAVPSSGLVDIWDDKGEGNRKIKKRSKTTLIPAVEVEPPGCSYNPAHESHQDALACAVAEEMQKVYKNELGPEPVPLTVPGKAMTEEEMYFVDVDDGDDGEDDEISSEDGDAAAEKQPSKIRRVTKVELNKRARRKERQKIEEAAKKKKGLSKEIDCIPDIIQEIEKEEEEKQKRHLRRAVAKQERLKAFPPRLGKRKFQPAPLQVLLSEEISGSLRRLKGCCTLVKDRYKSLEKRGLVVPPSKSRRR